MGTAPHGLTPSRRAGPIGREEPCQRLNARAHRVALPSVGKLGGGGTSTRGWLDPLPREAP